MTLLGKSDVRMALERAAVPSGGSSGRTHHPRIHLCPRRLQSSGQEPALTFCADLPAGTPGHLSDLNPRGLSVGGSLRNRRTKGCVARVGGKIPE